MIDFSKRFLPVFALCLLAVSVAEAGSVLQRIRHANVIRCGTDIIGTGLVYEGGPAQAEGFDVAMCRSLAAAVLGNPQAAVMVPMGRKSSLDTLSTGQVDVYFGGLPVLPSLEFHFPAVFAETLLYSRQGFIAYDKPEATSMEAYRGDSVCVVNEPNIVRNLQRYNQKYGLNLKIVPAISLADAKRRLYTQECSLLSDQMAVLASPFFKDAPEGSSLMILPEIVEVFPTGPLVSTEDPEWRKIVSWVVRALIRAEEKGITQENLPSMRQNGDLEARALLGGTRDVCCLPTLDAQWAYRALSVYGNYGEMFEKTLGKASPIGLEREENNLISKNGLLLAPAFY